MNKKCIISILIALFICGNVFADVVMTTRRVQEPNTNQVNKENKLADSVKMCKPYSENLKSNVGGMNFNFNIKILGWENNKCRLDFVAKSDGVNSLFSALYGVDASDAKIYTFEPNVKCAFTKQQLEAVGDSILQEAERSSGATNNMLKNPSEISLESFTNMSSSDSKLLDILLSQGACNITNVGNSADIFNSLFNF